MARRLSRALAVATIGLVAAGCKGCGPDERASTEPESEPTSAYTSIPATADLPTITRWAAKGPPPHRVILLVHGAGGPPLVHNKWMRPYTEGLTAAGYDVYMPHYFEKRRGTEIETVRATLGFLEKRPDTLADRIGAVGFSRGGFLAVELASVDDRIKTVVEFYGGIHHAYAAKLTRMPPTLILHGDKDPDVKVEHAYELQRLFDEKHVTYELHVYPGEEHGFGGAALTDSVKRMVTFLDRN